MSPLALRQQIGQLLVAGFDGSEIPVELKALAREFSIGGVILFKRNVQEPDQVRDVARQIEALGTELPPWVAVDQEGGRVARLKRPFTEWPPMIALGRSGSTDLARRFGRALAEELSAVGVTLDYAPVLDVLTSTNNPAIGDRALAETVDVVSELGRVIITELQNAGIAACGKHFPGHGDTSVDSHHELPFTGVIFTDDMEMQALAARWPVPDACVQAVAAGCDGVLVCSGNTALQFAAIEALVHAVEDERLPWSQIEDSLLRHRRMKERFLATRAGRTPERRGWRSVLGRESHAAIAEEIARFV